MKDRQILSDEEIIELYFARDEQAIVATDEKYNRVCTNIAMNILGNHADAEECVSDTWLGAWNAMPPHRPAVLSSFLGKITRRLAMKRWRYRDALRRGSGETSLALEELADCIPAPDGDPQRALETTELARLLDTFLDGLPETERRVFVCRYWHMLSVAEIARRFGFGVSKVKSMLMRTRLKLRETLEKEGVTV